MSKSAHILCVAAGKGSGQFAPKPGFTSMNGSISEMVTGDLWVGPRPYLEALKPADESPAPIALIDSVVDTFLEGKGKDRPSLTDLMKKAGILSGKIVEYPSFIQIIPYYLFRNQGRFFHYLRPDKGSETRLHGKVSIGIGGHIDFCDIVADAEGKIDLAATLDNAGKREGNEEIGAKISDHAFRYIGVLYAVDTEVDRLHLGIVGICDLTDEEIAELQPNHEIADHGFATLAEIRSHVEADPNKTLETWTRMIIESNPLA